MPLGHVPSRFKLPHRGRACQASTPPKSSKRVARSPSERRCRCAMVLPGRDPMTIKPRLLAVEPERELRWKGRLLVPGLFDGEHVFALTPLDDGRTRLDHWERFGGLLLPIARHMVYEDTVRAFNALNEAPAARSASRSAVRTSS